MGKYNKLWVALVTALVSATALLVDLFGPDASEVIAVVVAFAGALGVYAIPNEPAIDDEILFDEHIV